jgi:AAA domain, putative AbiEii toxin, Type IV TA system
LEEKRGDEPRTHAEILADKLYWTFQPDSIGDLVRKGSDGGLSANIMLHNPVFVQEPAKPLNFSFGSDAQRGDVRFECQASRAPANSIFLPAKEVLSLHHIILRSRDEFRLFGFDDTYVDLAKALSWQPDIAGFPDPVAQPMADLEDRLGGRVKYHLMMTSSPGIPIPQPVWRFKTGNDEFSIGMAAEGARKIAILDTLFRNRYLGRWSIVFIDEPEAALHPEAISSLLDVIVALIELFDGQIQFFFASHSYFVVKKLYLIAQEKGMSIPVAMAEDGRWEMADLKEGMPSNPIIDESIRLYKEEVELALK